MFQSAPTALPSRPPSTSIHPLLHSCATTRELHQLHALAIKSDAIRHLPVASRILSLYSRPEFRCTHLARSVFDHIPRPDSYCWNTIIKCFLEDGRLDGVIALFRVLLCGSDVLADNFTYPSVMKACASLCAVEEGKQIHGMVVKSGFWLDCFVQGSLVNFYAKCGESECARKVFDGMPEKDLVSWNSMIDGYVKCGEIMNARKLFDEMPERDVISWTSLINGYARCGEVESARMVFDSMPVKNVVAWNAMLDGYMKNGNVDYARLMFDEMPERNVVSWNSMITGYGKNGFCSEALEVFELMLRSNVVPNNVTFVGALSAAAGVALLEKGLFVHKCIEGRGVSMDGVVGTCLIDMYAKCGSIENALKVFRKLPKRRLGHWTAILVGLGMHGMYTLATDLFREMIKIGLNPHPIAFVGILNACSHTGMVDEGRRYFKLMTEKYGIKPTLEHYGCLVDLLCRVGFLSEAKDVIEKMPMRPNLVVWMSLLSGCRKHKNAEIGEYAAERVIELAPGSPGCYTLLSNIYAASNKWDKVSQIREIMKQKGIRKEPGQSSLEHEGVVHHFVAGGVSSTERNYLF